MKNIINWDKATIIDLEADNLLKGATKIHVMSYQLEGDKVRSLNGLEQLRIEKFFVHHIENKIPVVAHNGIGYDIPLVEKLFGIDLSGLMVIDSLALSWYLNYERKIHGLDSFFEDYGISKPKVDDWENLSYEEYRNRCEEDVKITKALWEDFKLRLLDMYSKSSEQINLGNVGGKRVSSNEVIYLDRFIGEDTSKHIERLLTFLMFKMDCARLQERTRWEVDVDSLLSLKAVLDALISSAKEELEGVMPKVPKYVKRSKPSKPFKKDGSLSSTGEKWEILKQKYKLGEKDSDGNLLVQKESEDCFKELTDYSPPNINGSQQIKDFLFSKGWKPISFKYERDEAAMDAWVLTKPKGKATHHDWEKWKLNKPKDRAIPQISVQGDNGKELCQSVVDLAEKVPEVMAYSKYTTIKHRLGMVEGFIRDLDDGKYLKARIGGFTNTLRVQHRELVNLPGVDKPYGKEIRGLLIAGEGKVCLGSDLSSLEDRVKHHFMLPHDPKYVATMQEEDYDPHLFTALSAGLITEAQFLDYKGGKKDPEVSAARKAGKSCNYASVYSASPPTIARSAGVDQETGKRLFDGYWELNWAVKEIANEQVVIEDSRGGKWLVNPINGFCYNIRADKDRFSTLCQGTGSYFFDVWVDKTLTKMRETWGKESLTASYHDEKVIVFKDLPIYRKEMEKIVKGSIVEINEEFMLRRGLGCDVQFGKTYAEIH